MSDKLTQGTTKSRVGFNEQMEIYKELQQVLTPPDEKGYISYKDDTDSDEVIAGRMSEKLNRRVSESNVKYVRNQSFGKLRSINPMGFSFGMAKLAELEAKVNGLASGYAGLNELVQENIRRSDYIEDRVAQLIDIMQKSIIPDPDGRLSKLRDKYRVTKLEKKG